AQLRDGGDGGVANPRARKQQQRHKPRGATGATKMNRWRFGEAPSSFGPLEVLPAAGCMLGKMKLDLGVRVVN
ncbi:hypothetical protein HN51_000233, partial [Arachis hypogaea]